MKIKYDKFAFDLDGTLIDSNFRIKDGVVDMFYGILTKVENPKIMICTGNGLREVARFLNKLYAELQQKQQDYEDAEFFEFKKPSIDIACYGGAFVVKDNAKGEVVWNKKITTEQFEKIRQVMNGFDKDAFIILQTIDGLFYCEPNGVKNKVKIMALKSIKSIVGFNGISVSSLNKEEYNQKLQNNEVYSLNILTGHIADKCKLREKLRENCAGVDCTASTTIQMRNGDKLNAIKNAFNIENGEGLVYVGDGLNDISSMKFAELSLAVGDNVKVLTSAKFALESIADASDLMFTEVDYSDVSRKVIENALKKNKEKKKQVKLDDDLDIMGDKIKI